MRIKPKDGLEVRVALLLAIGSQQPEEGAVAKVTLESRGDAEAYGYLTVEGFVKNLAGRDQEIPREVMCQLTSKGRGTYQAAEGFYRVFIEEMRGTLGKRQTRTDIRAAPSYP